MRRTSPWALNTLAFEKGEPPAALPQPGRPRHLANEVDADAVAALEAAVVEAYEPVSHRYYRLKARDMGRKTLDYWDRNALAHRLHRLYDRVEARGPRCWKASPPRLAR